MGIEYSFLDTILFGYLYINSNMIFTVFCSLFEYIKSNIYVFYSFKDTDTGHWWVTDIEEGDKPDIHIGYWPKELFDLMGDGANILGIGGAVQSSSSGVSPPMGNGHLPTKKDMDSARVSEFLYRYENSDFKNYYQYSKLDKLLDSEKCYGLKKGDDYFFTFGGPGGNSCGI